MNKPVRVRFAPSPTGGLHIGGVRTALYNYLFAKKNQGTFLIRIEDTDQTRFVEGAEQYIYEALRWLGIEAAESPEKGGPHAPYRQSERKAMYMQYAMELLEKGHAYYAFDTPEELDEMRQKLEAAKAKNPSYNAISRMQMKNSLTLPEDEVKARLASGAPYAIRLKVPHKQEIRFQDLIKGWVMVHSSAIDDKVLMKSDGMPTYHLANIVDDHLMEISHVIRGEEWLPSAPLHVLLYQCFGWEAPQFAHLPLILKPDLKDEKGRVIEKRNGKLSKRDGDEMGFPVFPLNWQGASGYREAGYLPEAIINFLALLGWNPGNNEELFTMEQLLEAFSLERINESGAKFDIDKAKWFNQHYLRAKAPEQLLSFLRKGLTENKIDEKRFTEEQLLQICNLMKERATFPDDLWREALFLFQAPTSFNSELVSQKINAASLAAVQQVSEALEADTNFSGEQVKHFLHEAAEKAQLKLGQVMPTFRIALTGLTAGPDLGAIAEILGKEEVLRRLRFALGQLSVAQ